MIAMQVRVYICFLPCLALTVTWGCVYILYADAEGNESNDKASLPWVNVWGTGLLQFSFKDKRNTAKVIRAFQDRPASYHLCCRWNLEWFVLCKQVCPNTQSQNVPTWGLWNPLSQCCEIPELCGIWCEQDNTPSVGVKWPIILTVLRECMPRLDTFWALALAC